MSEIININFPSAKPVGFFSSYHQADLFVYIKGSFTIQINSPEKFVYSSRTAQLLTADLISAIQSSLSLAASDDDICRLFADVSIFDRINEYIKVCLENWDFEYGIEFIKLTPSSVSFDDESIEIIRIAQQMKSDNGSTVPRMISSQADSQGGILWKCSKCGCMNDSKFCKDCGTPKKEIWKCEKCGTENDSLFCKQCGAEKSNEWQCVCGSVNKGNFCPKCGNAKLR